MYVGTLQPSCERDNMNRKESGSEGIDLAANIFFEGRRQPASRPHNTLIRYSDRSSCSGSANPEGVGGNMPFRKPQIGGNNA